MSAEIHLPGGACRKAGCELCAYFAAMEAARRAAPSPVRATAKAANGHRHSPVNPPARRPLQCVSLGRVLRRAGCGTCRRDDVRHCEAGHGEVSQNGRCDAVNPDGSFVCGDYRADD